MISTRRSFRYLVRKDMTGEEAETFLTDTRELLKCTDDHNAQLALTIFSYRVRKYNGAYAAALGSVDAIIFGGGIGENTALVRTLCVSSRALANKPKRLDTPA